MQAWIVQPEEEGRRLREILRGSMRISYSAIKSAKWNGQILRNGQEAHVDVRVQAGDHIEVRMPDAAPRYETRPYALPLSVPYEDEYLMVVDKPAPLASQSSAGHPDNSLENAVFHHLGCPEGFIYRPVNRLDRGTSGLMVVAKDGHTQDRLQQALHTEAFRREYLALTEGVPDPREGVIDLPIGKADGATIRREVRPDGKPARTFYRVLQVWEGTQAAASMSPAAYTPCAHILRSSEESQSAPRGELPVHSSRALVRLRLETGRTHQIRVHLAALGCPVCGDFLYGRELPEEFPQRFALHSTWLRFVHPHTGGLISLESLPEWGKLREK